MESLYLPELASARTEVAHALIRVSESAEALDTLKVGAKVAADVEANRELFSAPTTAAHRLYTGVLFSALDAGTLTPSQLQAAAKRVLIFSGLFGVNGFTDQIPAYRLSMDVSLPLANSSAKARPTSHTAGSAGVKLGTFWKNQMEGPMREATDGHIIVDCRSASYGRAFTPPPQHTLMVNNFVRRDGETKVVTHFAKHARGELTGMLLRSEQDFGSIDDIAHVASSRWSVELRPASGKTPHQLDLITVE